MAEEEDEDITWVPLLEAKKKKKTERSSGIDKVPTNTVIFKNKTHKVPSRRPADTVRYQRDWINADVENSNETNQVIVCDHYSPR
jgi:hypothetical protein